MHLLSDRKRLQAPLLVGLTLVALAHTCCLGADQTKISGWTEVSKKWPLGEGEYFVATKKAHHFVEVKLPEKIESDLIVRLEYFFNYQKVRPTLEIVSACNDGVNVIDQSQRQGAWLEHKVVVKKSDCERRDTIEYNVLLHDSGDVFAWRVMEVKSVGQGPADVRPSPAPELTPSQPEKKTESETQPPAVEEKKSNFVDWSPSIQNKKKEPEKKRERTREYVRWPRELLNVKKSPVKRAADEGNEISENAEPIYLMCKPSSCNRDEFHVSKFFLILSKGLPKLPDQGALEQGAHFYLSTDSQPLSIQQEFSEDVAEANPCLELQLYMDAGTKLELSLDENLKDKNKETLLETIERLPGDSTVGKWDLFKRCVSDYMPRLKSNGDISNQLRWTFKPQAGPGGQQLAMLVDSNAFALRKNYASLQYLPNVQNYASASEIENFWVLDKDGAQKPKVDFWAPGESSSAGAAKKRALRIYDIDASQESFDLTSRWIKVDDLEILQNPLYVMYRADKEPWIKSVYFEYQNAKKSNWVSQEVYKASTPDATDTSASDSTDLVAANTGDTGKEVAQPEPQVQQQKPRQILLPIKVKGLTKDEFRFRIRHLIDEKQQQSEAGGYQLSINTLAFGDACAETSYCLNGGACRPTGPGRAQCTCLPGYSGAHCQTVRPCEVLYNGKTGKELCESVGAQCITDLPVFRCRWPNDKYYKCDALYKPTASESSDPNSNGYEPVASESSEPNGQQLSGGQVTFAELKEKADNQAKLIIIMGVFMVAMMLFAVVIVANMVSRLMKTKRRLKRAQGDAVELARRSGPVSSVASTGGRPALGRHKLPNAPAAYSNQSFDVE